MRKLVRSGYFIFFAGCAAFRLVLRARKHARTGTSVAQDSTRLAFRWSYIALPLAILAMSLVTALVAYPRLPDPVAYHFRFDGTPDRWLSREAVVLLVLAPQLVFTIIAGAIPLGAVRLLSLRAPFSASARVDRVVALMGNMMALPQVLLYFTTLDIVSYNSYGGHIMPLWVFTLILMAVGILTLGWFFRSAVRLNSDPRRTSQKER